MVFWRAENLPAGMKNDDISLLRKHFFCIQFHNSVFENPMSARRLRIFRSEGSGEIGFLGFQKRS